jgi:hypothetical protein
MSSVGSNSATAANSAKPGSAGVKGRVNQFGSYMRNNPMSVRIIGGIGGLGLSIVSILGCFAIFNTFLKPISYILNIFYLIFGLAICIVTVLPESFLAESIYKQAHFMSTLGGKSVFFLYLGCLLIGSGLSGSVASWIYILIGSWMLFSCGVLLFVKCKGGEGSSPQQPTA